MATRQRSEDRLQPCHLEARKPRLLISSEEEIQHTQKKKHKIAGRVHKTTTKLSKE